MQSHVSKRSFVGLGVLGAVTLGVIVVASQSPARADEDKGGATCPNCHDADCEYMVGINMAGAEFAGHDLPGVEGRSYGWPSAERLDYWKSKGIRLIRLPILWERLQPELQKDFEAKYFAGLKKSMDLMAERDMLVIIDLHNYAKYRKKALGSKDVPIAAFADVWSRLAKAFKDNKATYGYGLMNEPHTCDWAACVQAAVDAIRKVDTETRIYVANDYPGWYATHLERDRKYKDDLVGWAEKNMRIGDPKTIKDPSNRIRWELHTYMDHDASGTYKHSYADEAKRTDGPGVRVSPQIGVQRVKPFVLWLKKHNQKGLIGEYSVPAPPDKDKRWLVALENMLAYLEANCVPSTYWAGGERWSRHAWVIGPNGWPKGDPRAQENRPQLDVLLKHAPKTK